MSRAEIILSGFADEGPVSKRAEEQLTMMRALGLSYYTIRFVDVGQGLKNVISDTKLYLSHQMELDTLTHCCFFFSQRVCGYLPVHGVCGYLLAQILLASLSAFAVAGGCTKITFENP